MLILPTGKLADRIDSGVANFEKIRRELPSALLSVTLPILAIGLDEDPENIWDLSKERKAIEQLLNTKKSVRLSKKDVLKVLKNSAKKYSIAHQQLVQSRIDSKE